MITPELQQFIDEARAQKLSDTQIQERLKLAGWDDVHIEEVFAQQGQGDVATLLSARELSKRAWHIYKKHRGAVLVASTVLFFLSQIWWALFTFVDFARLLTGTTPLVAIMTLTALIFLAIASVIFYIVCSVAMVNIFASPVHGSVSQIVNNSVTKVLPGIYTFALCFVLFVGGALLLIIPSLLFLLLFCAVVPLLAIGFRGFNLIEEAWITVRPRFLGFLGRIGYMFLIIFILSLLFSILDNSIMTSLWALRVIPLSITPTVIKDLLFYFIIFPYFLAFNYLLWGNLRLLVSTRLKTKKWKALMVTSCVVGVLYLTILAIGFGVPFITKTDLIYNGTPIIEKGVWKGLESY